jgi:hypothetical protein
MPVIFRPTPPRYFALPRRLMLLPSLAVLPQISHLAGTDNLPVIAVQFEAPHYGRLAAAPFNANLTYESATLAGQACRGSTAV